MDRFATCISAESTAAFDRYGPDVPQSPIVISVPHAGRDYAPALLAQARVPPQVLRRLEDRHADALAEELATLGCPVLVARAPRALIDLNRDEREIDPAMLGGVPHGHALISSAKLRGGLGLIPRRLQGAGELWHGPIDWHDVARRIETVHRPYHRALAGLLARARDGFGHAILLDIHSMPPLSAAPGGGPPVRIVLGDRFGRSAAGRLTALAADLCRGRGVAVAQNHPYPGNHLLDRHGRPEQGLHALQVEVDRGLYLDDALDRPGPGLAGMQRLMADMAGVLASELPRIDHAQAAE